MTRTRLWSVTALVCALLAWPSLPGLPAHWLPMLVRLLQAPDPDLASAAAAVGAACMAFGLVLFRRSPRARTDVVMALARRGNGVPAIARRTRLAQDAVRDVLGPGAMAASAGGPGKFCRAPAAGARAAGPSFADVLEESSFDARA